MGGREPIFCGIFVTVGTSLCVSEVYEVGISLQRLCIGLFTEWTADAPFAAPAVSKYYNGVCLLGIFTAAFVCYRPLTVAVALKTAVNWIIQVTSFTRMFNCRII
jgi:hypothetical protein